MKTKKFSLLASMALLSFASCTDEVQELANEQFQALKQIVMIMQDFQPEADSRTVYQIADGAVKCTWATNDTVGVFPNEGTQVYFPMTSGAGTKNATFDGKGWALKDGSTYAAYYPFIGAMYLDRNAVPVNYIGQTQVGNGSMAHLGATDYMVATPTAPEFGSAQFMFKHLSALVQLKITVPEPATFTSVKLVTDTQAFAVKGKVDIMADAPVITPVTSSTEVVLNLQDVATTEENEEVTFYFMLPPTDLSGKTLKAVLTSDKGNVEVDLESKNFKAGMVYALSGELESTEASYKDGVVRIAEAGSMKQLLGDNLLNITSLKVVGPINGDDVLCLRQMLGAISFYVEDRGKLNKLDLSEVSIVEGGEWYYEDFALRQYYTSSDAIGGYMFYGCTNLQDIVLPAGVTSIGNYAFHTCSSLTSIDIPDSVTSIGKAAFYNCSALTSVAMGADVMWIGDQAFSDCFSLTSIDIPDCLTSIGESAFYGCSSLTSVTMGTGVTSIGISAFYGCSSLISVHITDLSAWCKIEFNSNPLCYGAKLYLNNQELKELVIPEGIMRINDSAFTGCSSLVSIDIPNSVTSIGNSAFESCSSLTSVTMGTGVTWIGDQAFGWCSSLTSTNIPDSVTSIGENAFYGCSSLASATMGTGVTRIGHGAFYACSSLTSIDIPVGVTEIGLYTFCNCSSLTSVTMGADVIWIGDYAFSGCLSLTSIDIPDGVTSIGEEAFYLCVSLKSVTMGNGVTSIADGAFYVCPLLESVHITDLSAWCNITFGDSFSNPLYYNGGKLYLNNNLQEELVIPVDIEQIKDYAFNGCRSIRRITMGEGITSIGVHSFRDCSSLVQVNCLATIPPMIRSSSTLSSFDGSSDKKKLYVPKGYSSTYQSSSWADFFGTIKEME